MVLLLMILQIQLILLIKSAINTTTVNYDAAALAGAADEMTITVSGTNSTTIAITDDSAATTSALETINFNSISVANTLADLQVDGVLTSTLSNIYWWYSFNNYSCFRCIYYNY